MWRVITLDAHRHFTYIESLIHWMWFLFRSSSWRRPNVKGLLVTGPIPNGPLGSDQPFAWRGKRNHLPVLYRQWSMSEIHFCAHSSRAQALWRADDSNPFPHILFLVKARSLFIIRESVTVYWICSLQPFKLECFIGLPSFEPTKCTTHFIFFHAVPLIFLRET
jgi:hypothetical protein